MTTARSITTDATGSQSDCGDIVYVGIFADGLLPLVGYSDQNVETAPDKRYSLAKEPKRGFRWKSKTITPEQAKAWAECGGWIGARVPVGYALVDVDDRATADTLIAKYRGQRCGIIKTPRGGQFIFRDNGKIDSQTTRSTTVSGIKVDYRLPGKGYFVLPWSWSGAHVLKPGLRYWVQLPEVTP